MVVQISKQFRATMLAAIAVHCGNCRKRQHERADYEPDPCSAHGSLRHFRPTPDRSTNSRDRFQDSAALCGNLDTPTTRGRLINGDQTMLDERDEFVAIRFDLIWSIPNDH
ncbi:MULTISPECIES: hypothetical protein [Burkholderia cepacia complex]|uniref:hypothetical protein n=1 Tax=Burkholderia cepacia complex TaxID=87882 RepID=UPI00157A5080